MNLPNAEQARVELGKVRDYLLNVAHPDGAAKARFFMSFGFRTGDLDLLIEALRRHGMAYPVAEAVDSPFGRRYSVDGALESPDGRHPAVRTVWIVEDEGAAPRLITAHPIRKRES